MSSNMPILTKTLILAIWLVSSMDGGDRSPSDRGSGRLELSARENYRRHKQ